MQISLIGQPNVGKSTLFTRLTGVGVISSNYPGTTVEFEEATMLRKNTDVHIHDLPGTYSLSGNSADEQVVIDMLLDSKNDAIIVVADAVNLESSLTLCMEVMELGFPSILALNRIDAARKRFVLDIDTLSKKLGIPVIPVSARTGEGIEELMDCITEGKASVSVKMNYSQDLMECIKILAPDISVKGLNSEGVALKLLENSVDIKNMVDDKIISSAEDIRSEYKTLNSEDIAISIAKERFQYTSEITESIKSKIEGKRPISERISELTITPITGFPILFLILFCVFEIIIYAGEFLDGIVNGVWESVVGTAIVDVFVSIGGDVGNILGTAINDSLLAILCIVIPYIMVFYILLGILEDTGYLPRAVVLLDRFMHKLGIHGNGFIPIMVGLGCNVPAIMATRSLSSKRERRIVCSIIIMAIPCSAQISIIFGITGVYSGMIYSMAIALVLIVLAILIGIILNKVLPSQPSNLAMELPDLTLPSIRNILFKTWSRSKDFFYIAVPLLLVGGIIVEFLIAYNIMDVLVQPLSFITVGMLGLPAITIIAFIVGILRKEMAYVMLLILAGSVPITEFMTPDQFVVFGVVMAIYMPCVATIAAMSRELGWKDTAIVSLISIGVAVLIGSAFNLVLGII